jgi:Xaa-Pro aminopeptidase
MDFKSRIRNLRNELEKRELDGILIYDQYNRRYLSGFTGSFGVLFIDMKDALIATDSRYYIQVKKECPDFTLLGVGKQTSLELIMEKKKLEGKKIAFESDVITVDQLKYMRKKLKGVKLVPTQQVVKILRSIKTAEEIRIIEKVQKITDKCFAWLLKNVKPGMTELEIAWMIEKFQHENGAEANSFSSIVASGPNSAMPHAVPTNRKVKKGEPLLFDFGCTVEGYNSDMTRVVFFGKPSAKMVCIYHKVLETHLMVFELSQPGTRVAEIDKISRQFIYTAKWNDKCLMGSEKGQGIYEHGLGHGVGLEVHELPVLSYKLLRDVLKPGHLVTNEPGIYVEGEGGVRIEDMMFITSDGADSLTHSPKEMIVL